MNSNIIFTKTFKIICFIFRCFIEIVKVLIIHDFREVHPQELQSKQIITEGIIKSRIYTSCILGNNGPLYSNNRKAAKKSKPKSCYSPNLCSIVYIINPKSMQRILQTKFNRKFLMNSVLRGEMWIFSQQNLLHYILPLFIKHIIAHFLHRTLKNTRVCTTLCREIFDRADAQMPTTKNIERQMVSVGDQVSKKNSTSRFTWDRILSKT